MKNRWLSWIDEPMLSLLVQGKARKSYLSVLIFAFFSIAVVALTGPATKTETNAWKGDPPPLWVVMDLSLSMLSEDQAPNRLSLVKYRITDLLREQKSSLASLVVYSKSAHTVVPLTQDAETILHQLPSLHPEMMPAYGSNALSAFSLIARSIDNTKVSSGKIIWFTDQANKQEIAKAAALSKQKNQALLMVIVGTKEGSSIPLSDGLLRQQNNELSISLVPVENMLSNAKRSGIEAVRIEDLTPNIMAKFSQSLISTKQAEQKEIQRELTHEVGYWLIIPMLLLMIPLMRSSLLVTIFSHVSLTALVLLGMSVPDAQASWWQTKNQQAWQLAQEKRYDEANKLFEDPAWQATTAYRAEDFESAAKQFSELKQYYNMGNALAVSGDIEQAISAYKKTLSIDPEHENAQHNLSVLEQLQSQSQQSSQEGDQSQENSSSDETSSQQQEADKNGDPSEKNDSEQSGQSLAKDDSHLEEDETEKKESGVQNNADDPPSQDQTSTQVSTIENEQLSPEQIAERESSIEYKQWLRQLTQDPSSLLKRKFQHQLKQRKNKKLNQASNNQIW